MTFPIVIALTAALSYCLKNYEQQRQRQQERERMFDDEITTEFLEATSIHTAGELSGSS